MVIHGVYNFIGISVLLYFKEDSVITVTIDDMYIYTPRRRRAMSLGFINNFEFYHRINKSSINPKITESINKYREMEKNRAIKYENMKK